MPLFVPNDSTYSDYILPDFLKIVGGDTSVGDGPAPDPGWKNIEYGHIVPGDSQSQFFSIVHGTINYNIMLKYVQSSFPLPDAPDPKTGQVRRIAEVQGAVYGPGWGTANPIGSGVILVYLDAYNDNGANYWVRAQDGSKIFSPRWVQLFHELSHALHIARGAVTLSTPEAQEDALTITDENKLRSQYQSKHPWLKQRDLSEEGGSGMQDPEPAFNNPTSSAPSPCLVVSAVSGSSRSRQVRRLQGLRRALIGNAVLADELVNKAATTYLQVAPIVVAAMEFAPTLRNTLARVIVDPLIEFYSLLRAYSRPDFVRRHFMSQVERTMRHGCRRVAQSGQTMTEIDLVCHEIGCMALGRQERPGNSWIPHSSQWAQGDAPISEALGWLRTAIAAAGADDEPLRWLTLMPVHIYWSTVRRFACKDARIPEIVEGLEGDCERWLSRAPIADVVAQLIPPVGEASMRQLARTVFTREAIRHQLTNERFRRVPLSSGGVRDLRFERSGLLPDSAMRRTATLVRKWKS